MKIIINIPPKHYHGKIPAGYRKSDFVRFDKVGSEIFAITKNNERVSCD